MATIVNTRRQQAEASRNAIIEAAINVFSTLGYEGGSFREITARSGAKRSLVLYHFRNKEILWQEAMLKLASRAGAAYTKRYQPDSCSNDRERVAHSLECFLDALIEVPEYGRVFLREGSTDSDRMQWLATSFAPAGTLDMRFDDPKIRTRLRETVISDVLMGALVSFVALRPMMDATMNLVSGEMKMTKARKQEFIRLMVNMIFAESE